jgi:hypothetical protein
MTEEQRFLFDVRGWLLVPAVLAAAEIEPIKQHIYNGGDGFTGPAQELLDHPVLVDILTDLLGHGLAGDEGYPFRCENSFVTIRQEGWHSSGTATPHCGGPVGPFRYQTDGRRQFGGMMRIVWELNPVDKGDGGTLFLSGSHKASFPFPPAVLQPDNEYLESYSCPAGSLFLFTESLLHASTTWVNPHRDRAAIFYSYNHLSVQYHKLNLPHEVISTMPPKRRSLFRGVWLHDFATRPEVLNQEYSPANHAY